MGNQSSVCNHYNVKEWDVYFCNKKVKEASSDSFIDLGNGYGKDIFDVFYEGKLLKNADADSFNICNNSKYDAKDKFNKFFKGKKI